MAEPAIQLELHPPPANQPPQAGHQLQGGAWWLITTSKTALLCLSHQSEIWRLSREIRIPAVFPMFMCCIGSKGAQCGAACQTANKKQQTSSCKNATHHQKSFSVVHAFLFFKIHVTLLLIFPDSLDVFCLFLFSICSIRHSAGCWYLGSLTEQHATSIGPRVAGLLHPCELRVPVLSTGQVHWLRQKCWTRAKMNDL